MKLMIAALCVCAAASLGATTLVPVELDELSRVAQAVAVGRVIAVESQWVEDHRSIETQVTLDVDTYLKGALGQTVSFRVPGGQLGQYRQVVIGSPMFEREQHVVVFLGARGPSMPYVLGLSQGVFRMQRAADGSGWVVTPPTAVPALSGSTPIVRGDTARRPVALADFEQRVRALAGGAR